MTVDATPPATLLEPSLANPAGAVELYSARACFFISFFGGSLAALTMGWLNARRLGRLRQDAWLFVVLGVGFLALLYTFAQAWDAGIDQVRWLGISMSKRELRRVSQGVGLVIWLCFYLRHKRFHRAMLIANVTPKKPWLTALAVIVGAGLAQWGLATTLLWIGA